MDYFSCLLKGTSDYATNNSSVASMQQTLLVCSKFLVFCLLQRSVALRLWLWWR